MRALTTHVRRHAVGYLALFVALSGVAYAATKAPKNSVVSKSIKAKNVKTSDLANAAVTEPKLGVPLDFVPAENVVRVEFSETCALTTDSGCTAHPQIPFKSEDFDLRIECSNNGGDGARLDVTVLKPGGRASRAVLSGLSVKQVATTIGNGPIVPNVTIGDTQFEDGWFSATLQTADEAHTVVFTGAYGVGSGLPNAGDCFVDGIAIGT